MQYLYSTATISSCGKYRYQLYRLWDRYKRGPIVWVMLNPSTADANEDDPTIRKCVGFSDRWGHGSMIVVNLYALRSTDPSVLRSHEDPEGPKNREMLSACLKGLVMFAWGSRFRIPKVISRKTFLLTYVLSDVRYNNASVMTLGRTSAASGHQPRHPLMLPYSTPRERVDLNRPFYPE